MKGQFKNIGILGGSFDPVHKGHVEMARGALEEVGLDFVYFMPTARTPLKEEGPVGGVVDRVKMLELALYGEGKMDYLDWEVLSEGPSYTIITAERLKRNWPGMNFYWIIGSDGLRTLGRWKDIEKLVKLVTFIVVKRKGEKVEGGGELGGIRGLRLIRLEREVMEVSSSEIRERLGRGEDCEELLEEGVYNYIKINKLYRT